MAPGFISRNHRVCWPSSGESRPPPDQRGHVQLNRAEPARPGARRFTEKPDGSTGRPPPTCTPRPPWPRTPRRWRRSTAPSISVTTIGTGSPLGAPGPLEYLPGPGVDLIRRSGPAFCNHPTADGGRPGPTRSDSSLAAVWNGCSAASRQARASDEEGPIPRRPSADATVLRTWLLTATSRAA
jgi:hypothetical protein